MQNVSFIIEKSKYCKADFELFWWSDDDRLVLVLAGG